MRYKVYQIDITPRSALVNTLGWAEAAKIYPEIDAYLATSMCGSEKFTPNMLSAYTPVAEVEARDLEDVFSILNLWNCPDAVTTLAPIRSLSVGDLVQEGNDLYMVDSIGFTKVSR